MLPELTYFSFIDIRFYSSEEIDTFYGEKKTTNLKPQKVFDIKRWSCISYVMILKKHIIPRI